jgi:hypothetical protein
VEQLFLLKPTMKKCDTNFKYQKCVASSVCSFARDLGLQLQNCNGYPVLNITKPTLQVHVRVTRPRWL